jgi:AcrR family transcriptional regulator
MVRQPTNPTRGTGHRAGRDVVGVAAAASGTEPPTVPGSEPQERSAPSSPRVAARQADARRRILRAARVVVAEQGFAAAQVAVVARVADVATGSIYRHFPSKASLFCEMLRVVCQRELEVVRAITTEPDRTVLERLGDAVATFVDRALRGEGLAYAVIVEPMDPEVDQVRLEARAGLAAAFAELIDEGITTGELHEQNARVRGAAIVGAFLEGVVAPLADRAEQTPDRDAISAEIALFARAGVAGSPPEIRPGVRTGPRPLPA